MRDEMYVKTMPLSEYEAMKKRIADLEAQTEGKATDKSPTVPLREHYEAMEACIAERERQTNRALKWRRQAAYYKLREARCMGEANYTSVERVDNLERQRDDLAAALRPFALAVHEIPDGVRSTLRYWNGALDGHDISLSIGTDHLIAAAEALTRLDDD